MSEKPTKIQRYAFVRSGKFRSVENRPDGDLMLYADHEADVAAQVAEAVEKERERWSNNEGGRLLDAAKRVGEVIGKGCGRPCNCDHCSVLRELHDAYNAVVRAAQEKSHDAEM